MAHHPTRARIGQEPEKKQKDQTLIRIRDVKAEHQDARCPRYSYMSLLQFRNNKHGNVAGNFTT